MKNIDELLTNGYDFNMGKYMGDGWDLFKKGAGNYIGFTLVFFIIIFSIVFIPFINFIVSIIEYVLLSGIFIYSRNLLNDKGEFSNFFEGFNSFGQIFLFALVLFTFTIPAIALLVSYIIPEGFLNEIMSGNTDPEYLFDEITAMIAANWGNLILLYFLFLMYMLYLYISYSFTLVLIVDRKMRFWEAMELSRKVIAKNFFSFLGMYILLGVITTVGMVLTCGLGTIVAIPYMNTVIFSAYNDIIGPDEEGVATSEEV